ncbi:RNA pseudouridine synthase [Massilia sp. TS11]|uniref:RNA pseudouridine synthase n=1 Tax=Massilia sp. TS11 TaxID=2908003 RepID=UPI001EDBE024|nr:RNA pseudouridine synthase [Massilia sp. TS11]MCG2583205.1 RNA pseudouridine synthase [Massilia sp. TS11]
MSEGEGIRLAKRVAAMLPCSRREAELYIEGGWVQVDGQTVDVPAARVRPEQAVQLQPGARLEEIPPVTLLWHKPAGVANALDQIDIGKQQGEDRFLSKHLQQQRLLTPLETEASGLVVYSQDYRVIRKLSEDASRIEHEFIIDLAEAVSEASLAALNSDPKFKASRQSEQRLRVVLKQTEVGQLGAACAAAGLKVRAQRRIRIGRLPMASLNPGAWRYLTAPEKF